MNERASTPEDDPIGQGHEPDDVNSRVLILLSGGLLLLVALVMLLMYGTFDFLAHEEQTTSEQTPVLQRTPTTAGPQLSPDQPQQLHQLRQSEEQRLSHYGWIDQQAGIARIPIDRAMEILAKRGLPITAPGSEEQHDDLPQ